jgi:hypothetical protein
LKKIIISAALAAALGIAGLIASRRDVPHPASEPPTPAPHLSKLPAKTERVDEEHDPARFESLDEAMRKIAEELETAAIKWNRARPLHESVHKAWNDWDDFSTARILELNTRQIRQLGEWATGEGINSDSELNDYRQAIIKIWSSREPDVVRACLLKIAEAEGFVGKEVNTWRNLSLEELSDNFHFYRVGHAMHDPKSAWETFLQDDADPRMKYFVDTLTTLPELFREYSSRAPEEAWKLTLTTTNEDYRRQMIEGFADGAPAGQEWNARSREFADSLADHGIEPSQWDFRSIAERWIMEDPVAALDWYARSAPPDALEWAIHYTQRPEGADPFAEETDGDLPDLNPEQAAELLKIDLLTSMYSSHKDRMDEVRSALEHLATHGGDPFAARTLGALIGESLDPMDTPLLGLIPKFPQREVRDQLFLQAVEAIPERTGNPSLSSSDSLEGPNLTLEAVRELAGKLDITPEIRAKAEDAFRKVEATELHALEVQEQLRRSKSDTNGDDPFSSR